MILIYNELYEATQLGNKLAVELFFRANEGKKIDFYNFNAKKLFSNYFHDNDIDFFEYHFHDRIMGNTLKDNYGTSIAVNSNLKRNRKNFTIAHEIGHIEMHLDYVDNIYFDTNCFSQDNQIEKEANAFAAGLLVPRSALISNLVHNNTAHQISVNLGVSKEVLFWRIVNYLSNELNYYSYVQKTVTDYFNCLTREEVLNSDFISILECANVSVTRQV